jgi:hypothetical protein
MQRCGGDLQTLKTFTGSWLNQTRTLFFPDGAGCWRWPPDMLNESLLTTTGRKMARKKLTEQELLKGLDAHTAHADELSEPLPQELTPMERLKGSVKRYDRR